jgi:hypothetical protein
VAEREQEPVRIRGEVNRFIARSGCRVG